MISTRNLSQLPDIPSLKRLCQSLALLDAIIEPDWVSRYYSFDAHWKTGETMASMRDGSGDAYFLLFHPAGAILKGFAHESAMSPYRSNPAGVWAGILDGVPPVFSAFLSEPALTMSDTTFCIWRMNTDNSWQRGNIPLPDGPDPDGSAELLAILDGQPKTYQERAQDYYKRPISLQTVTHIYHQRPLSERLVHLLNDEADWGAIEDEARTIGYGQP